MTERALDPSAEQLHFRSVVSAVIHPRDAETARHSAIVYGNAIGTLAVASAENTINDVQIDIDIAPHESLTHDNLRRQERLILDRIRDERMKKYNITPRMQQVTDLAARGYSNAQIGEQLSLAEATIKGYISIIMDHVGCNNRTALIGVLYLGHPPVEERTWLK